MLFNLNEFLMAISFTLDFVEMDLLGVTTNHGKRTAFISLKIAEELHFTPEQLHDIVALAILHDNGVSEKSLHDALVKGNYKNSNSLEHVKEHCIVGEINASQYPFLTDVKDVIKYHHERDDGKGFFNLKGEEIPLMSQIIHLADVIENNFNLENMNFNTQEAILKFVNYEKNKSFSSRVVNAFTSAIKCEDFWVCIKTDSIDTCLKSGTPQFVMETSFEKLRKITGVLSRIIDSKSKYTQKHSKDLAEKVSIMADFYNKRPEEKAKLIIAADLHDIGKLAVPNSILDSPNKLTREEFKIIKKHTYFTRIALQEISGFEDITEWASNHHEKLDGSGYPFGKSAEDLDFNSRLIACLDIYEALTEERPYRKSLNHEEAMEIMNKMKNSGFIDVGITNDIDYVFKNIKGATR